MSGRFWAWSLSVYAREGVSPALIGLQDEDGLDVNMILFALWLAAEGIGADAALMEQANAMTVPWAQAVTGPVRAARRAMKSSPLGDDVKRADLRQRLQTLELDLERHHQEALEAFAASRARPPADNRGGQDFLQLARANLREYFAALRRWDPLSSALDRSPAWTLLLRQTTPT